jgi:cobalt-precorrin 5A hydrolase
MSRVAGFGFRGGASTASLLAALRLVEAQGGPATALATLPARAVAPALLRLAEARGLPLRAVEVAGIATPTRSARVEALHGTGSVAEAAALAGAGPGATLTVGRITAPDGMATCAMAAGKDECE